MRRCRNRSIGLRLCAAFAMLLCAAASGASPPPAHKADLVVVIAVDQFSANLFSEYRQYFTGGLARLTRGAVFPNGYQSHAATETCPGHSTILTGARPARTGIIANEWFDFDAPRPDKRVYCAEDEHEPGSDSEHYRASPVHLGVPVLGTLMKRADPAARVAVVAGKDRAAMMMGGRGPDERWWWDGDRFIGSGAAAGSAIVAAANRSVASSLGRAHGAVPMTGICADRARAISLGHGIPPIGAGAFARPPGDSKAFRASPDLDAATLEIAAGLRREMALGRHGTTDLLILGLSATDYVGHRYGTQGSEMCLQLRALDRALEGFFGRLDAAGLDYLVVLTADHGGHDLPERQRAEAAADAARVDPDLTAAAVGRQVERITGLAGPLLFTDGPAGDIYVSDRLAPGDRARVVAEAAALYRAAPQVAAVFTADQLRAVPAPSGPPDTWSLLDRAKASFDPARSGDLVVLPKPLITTIAVPETGYVTTHGTPWDYDRRVPILFWRRDMASFEQPMAVETVDILPTLAAQIGLELDAAAIDGRCLDLDPGPQDSCR